MLTQRTYSTRIDERILDCVRRADNAGIEYRTLFSYFSPFLSVCLCLSINNRLLNSDSSVLFAFAAVYSALLDII